MCQPSYRAMSELTSMQAACWFGRSNNAILGGVSAHLYAEFDGQFIDTNRLNSAIEQLYQEHELLRLNINADGIPNIVPFIHIPRLEIDDFSMLSGDELEQKLLQKREQWTHQQLDLTRAETAKFSISLLKNNIFRFHVDTDMIAIDPSSFRRLMEDLALFYEDINTVFLAPPSFFNWYNKVRSDADLKKLRNRDRLWWKARLDDIAPAPSLPFCGNESAKAQSYRLNTWLQPAERNALKQLARSQQITLSSLVLSLFAFTLHKSTQDLSFRLNVPVFWREPLYQDIRRTIGDFADLVILDVHMAHVDTIAALGKQIASQMIELLEHSHYSGVNVMRDLSRYHGSAQLAPVVFTSALDLPEGELFSERVKHVFGSMNWAISQGPQVALDVQVANMDGGILINWDIRIDALPKDWITDLFHSFSSLLKQIAAEPERLNTPLVRLDHSLSKETNMQKPLNTLQKAYLLGRTTSLPLGGVAMQEFRQYHGSMDIVLLKQRLTEMVRRHESLRTYIDKNKLIQFVSNQEVIQLTEIDLTALTPELAAQHIQAHKYHYTHALFDLDQPPWDITVFLLKDHLLTIFVRFDALILDGRSIATLMLELFDGQQHEIEEQTVVTTSENNISQRQSDMAYWEQKLSQVAHAPQLPWDASLQDVITSRYQRKSLVIAPDQFKQMSKVGAKQALFKNSVIMSVILQVLSYWSHDGSLCVAVPTLPLYTGPFSNSSTFIAIEWKHSQHMAEQATLLQTDILEGLQHLSFSGVDLARLLFEKSGSGPVLPVVVTNGLSWPVLAESTLIKQQDGLTQTPQVAIDIRFSMQSNGALQFNIDYAEAAISAEMIDDFLNALKYAIDQITHSGVFNVELSDHFAELQSKRHYFNNYSLKNQIIREQTTVKEKTSQRNQLLNIYLETLGQPENASFDDLTHFTNMGLRPHHLKIISQRINETYAIQLSPAQLIHCRDVTEVEKLIAQY
nr:condensation domain-containing protein [Acinetobacter sp. Marseille-Q1620]